jgi:hypothetical protein
LYLNTGIARLRVSREALVKVRTAARRKNQPPRFSKRVAMREKQIRLAARFKQIENTIKTEDEVQFNLSLLS